MNEKLTLRGSFNLSIAFCSDLQYLDNSGTRCTSCAPEGELIQRDADGRAVACDACEHYPGLKTCTDSVSYIVAAGYWLPQQVEHCLDSRCVAKG